MQSIVIHRLAGRAFRRVLRQKQTRFRPVLAWLDQWMLEGGTGGGTEGGIEGDRELERLERIAVVGDEVYRGYRY